MTLKVKKSNIIVFIPLISLCILGFMLFYLGQMRPIIYLCQIIYVVATVYIISVSGPISLGSFFIYGFTLFVGSKILLYPFNQSVEFLGNVYQISENSNNLTALSWTLILLMFLAGYGMTPKSKLDSFVTKSKNPILKIALVISVTYAFFRSCSLLIYSYQEMYQLGGFIDLTIARLVSILLLSVIIHNDPKGVTRIMPIIALLVAGYLITGVRANAVILILFAIYVYSRTYNRFSHFTISIIAIVGLGLMLLVQWARQDFTWVSDTNIFEYVIVSQHRNYYLPGIMLDENIVEDAKYSFLWVFSDLFCSNCMSGNILSSLILGDLVKDGHGVGGIGLFDLLNGNLGVAFGILSILLIGVFIGFIESRRSKYYILYPVIFFVFYSHRSNIGYYLTMAVLFSAVLGWRNSRILKILIRGNMSRIFKNNSVKANVR